MPATPALGRSPDKTATPSPYEWIGEQKTSRGLHGPES